mgnify:CR=1 FL=1|tara:strand:+ start:2017 stop:2694 length:678 start_codon:yes stop_codon:yes gene_type:complete
MALIVSYIVCLFKTSNVPNDKKPLWAVVIFMGHFLAMPIFWYLYVWRPQFQNFSATVTENKNHKNNKGLIRALLMMLFLWFLLPLAVLIIVFGYLELISPWASLQKHYASNKQIDYQKNEYRVALSIDREEEKTFYSIKLKLSDTGFYFSSPTEFRGPTSRGNITMFLQPLFLPWSAIKECKKVQYKDYSKMRLKTDNTDVLIDMSHWDFLKPLCIEKGIPLIED